MEPFIPLGRNYLDENDPKMASLTAVLPQAQHWPTVLVDGIERFLGLWSLNMAYAKVVRMRRFGCPENFFRLASRYLNLTYDVPFEELNYIPSTGACVVVSNHPHGMSDGIMFGDILTRRRKDVRIIVNEQLSVCKEMEPWVIKVDVYDTPESKQKNIRGLREVMEWLKKGGCIGLFPAGSASSFSFKNKQVEDDPWNVHFASIIKRMKATVVPLHFSGRNSLLFQLISAVSRPARVPFLPREIMRDGRHIHHVHIGKPITPGQLAQFETDESMMNYARLRTYLLDRHYQKKLKPYADNYKDNLAGVMKKKLSPTVTVEYHPIIEPVPQEDQVKELKALPNFQLLMNKKNWAVYYARAEQIPHILREIGRLREVTFREVGEGSGLSCDLDHYDPLYYHLFLWDCANDRIVGAYRMGATDELIPKLGKKGLYISQFFEIDEKALSKMTPGLEMGRAFIVKDYQRHPLSLGMIWEGIGQFIARFPRYRYLFGTVSTSGEYTTLSHSLIVSFLRAHAMDLNLAEMIRSKTPPTYNKLKGAENELVATGLPEAQELSNYISQIEADGKGLPVLLKQYLKLNGKILAFGLDKDFGHVLDSLILVDIYKSPERSLRRYMGNGAYEKLQSYIQDHHIDLSEDV